MPLLLESSHKRLPIANVLGAGRVMVLVIDTEVFGAAVNEPGETTAAVTALIVAPPENTAPVAAVSLTVHVSPTTNPEIVPVAGGVKITVLVPDTLQTASAVIEGLVVSEFVSPVKSFVMVTTAGAAPMLRAADASLFEPSAACPVSYPPFADPSRLVSANTSFAAGFTCA
jgi:hypothetical protein